MSVYDDSVFERPLRGEEFVAEFLHTWPRHKGYITRAAEILNVTPQALARRLYRYKRDGMLIQFTDDVKKASRDQQI